MPENDARSVLPSNTPSLAVEDVVNRFLEFSPCLDQGLLKPRSLPSRAFGERFVLSAAGGVRGWVGGGGGKQEGVMRLKKRKKRSLVLILTQAVVFGDYA